MAHTRGPVDPPEFGGPVPNLRRGRAYAVHIHDAVIALFEDKPEQVTAHMHEADRLLSPLGADTANDLRDFIAGVASAAERLIAYYDEHLTPNVSDAPGTAPISTREPVQSSTDI